MDKLGNSYFKIIYIILLGLSCSNVANADTVVFLDGSNMVGNVLNVNSLKQTFQLDVVMEGELVGAKVTINAYEVDRVIVNNQYRGLIKEPLSEQERKRNILAVKERRERARAIEMAQYAERYAKEKRRADKYDQRDWQRELIRRQQEHELAIIEQSHKNGINPDVKVNVGKEPVINVKQTGGSSRVRSGNTDNLLLQMGQ